MCNNTSLHIKNQFASLQLYDVHIPSIFVIGTFFGLHLKKNFQSYELLFFFDAIFENQKLLFNCNIYRDNAKSNMTCIMVHAKNEQFSTIHDH